MPTVPESRALPALLAALSAQLRGACRLQLWVDDDRGLHPRATRGGDVEVADRALARHCCLRAEALIEAGRVVLPVGLSDRRIGALLVDFAEAPGPDRIAALQDWIAAHRGALDQSLADDRLARLSGGARQAEALRHALGAAHALEAAPSTSDAFAALHQALRTLMRAENFFVVLLDEHREWLHFDYYCDEYDRISSWAPVRFLDGRLQGLLSAIVVASGRVLRGHTEELLEQAGHGDTATDLQFGPNATDWIGVPMLIGKEAIGALILQDYTPGFRYDDTAPGILALLAEACATALHRRRVQSTLERIVTERTAELEASLQRLRRTQQQLVEAEKHAALGRLVAGVAHEINTPLGICVTAASHLDDARRSFAAQQSDGKLRRSELDRFMAISRNSNTLLSGNLERMAALVNRFRQIAAAVDSKTPTRLVLSDWLQGWAEAQGSRLQTAGHQLRCLIDAHLVMTIQAGVLLDILGELLDNALQHAPADADQPTPQPHEARAAPESELACTPITTTLLLELRARRVDQGIELSLADNGRGLPETEVNALFDPFYTTARHRGHVGLGLHRVQILVTQVLGGTISAERRPQGGSTFVLRLPDPG